ncbi:hypothetical protein [uncultured Sneathia sp.]|uniref:hypothetical protein n=1 Tax=uncultured Sneathia sp. TaxID=278067 RepID=UPI0025930E2F|nr:hypothetical protein [uncultured Sneathia sp.]
MKKTLLLTSIVASMVAIAGTTGSVEGYNENEATFVKNPASITFVAKKIGVKTEVKVNGTGFSFGGDFKAEDLELGKAKKANYLNHSSVWAKYELPELKGVKSYVKATVSPKFAELEKIEKDPNNVIKVKEDKGSAELEGQVSYKYGDFTFGLNSKTNFPLSNKEYKYLANSTDPTYDGTVEYGKLVKSTHKVFLESEKDKDVLVKGLKDVKANVEIKHNYAKGVIAGERVDYVKGNVELAYDGIKDLRMDGKIDFTVNVNGPKELGNTKLGDYNLKDIELGEEASKEPVDLVHTYNAKLTYTGVKGLTLAVAPFVSRIKKVDTIDIVMYGSSLNAQYKMLNDQLTLTGKALLERDSVLENGANVQNSGVVSLGANAKYDYKVSDKFTVSPEADAKLDLLIANHQTVPYLTLTPKVSAEYKPTDTLTLKGSVEVPVKFEIENAISENFEYKQTQLKTSLNLKYEWK